MNNFHIKNESVYDKSLYESTSNTLVVSALGDVHLRLADNVPLKDIRAGASANAMATFLLEAPNLQDDRRPWKGASDSQLVSAMQQIRSTLGSKTPQEYSRTYTIGEKPLVAFAEHPIGDPVFHGFGGCPVPITFAHAIGPDFGGIHLTQVEKCLNALRTIYTYMVTYASFKDIRYIRVMPISSGIYAGAHGDVILRDFVSFWRAAARTNPSITIDLCFFELGQCNKAKTM